MDFFTDKDTMFARGPISREKGDKIIEKIAPTDESIDDLDVEKYGHMIEYHEKFTPDRTNTEFVNIAKNHTLKMRVHERGACETRACGSGSLATVIAACEAGYTKKNEWIAVKQPGGMLEILYGDELKLKGQAELSFKGTIHFP